ncbi:hypothetical protein ETAA8_47780 [Anatilimnocola aggregata]|uniref:Ketohydroxyglutarate aldolase n=1 Tax=Anatilimnocola aggregata TaxID=2528021 RepID=A0A517YHH1_9BACT|nr:hypothetical protein [Anatilimnocola aggregata]QDU29663.1 hypothetical protein ETAA8_47780 [Anatilimnocola aggregata]
MPPADKSVVITVTDEALGRIQELAQTLESKGLKVERVLPVTGVISGTCSAAQLAGLKKVAGVMSASEEISAGLWQPESSE